MKFYICETCGVQYEKTIEQPDYCKICSEERQYIGHNGQRWTTLEKMMESGKFKNSITLEEEGLHSIKTTPNLGIGQTAYWCKTTGLICCGIVLLIWMTRQLE